MNKALVPFLVFLLISSCVQENKIPTNSFDPKVVDANGYIVPQDSITEPIVIIVDEKKLTNIPVQNPTIISTNSNVHPAGIPRITTAGSPTVCTPGSNGFELPKVAIAIDLPFVAGMPQIVEVRDASTKDQNPQNFSFFQKLHGLKHDGINCMIQDKKGNLWFGTDGAGVTKYDGKTFTNYTEIEGLSGNTILSIYEDVNDNMWFGTFGGGVSKYDGRNFTHFNSQTGFSDSPVWGIFQDQTGNIWFGTDGDGVFKYDEKTFARFSKSQGLSNDSVRSIFEDRLGNIWFGTYGGGACKFNGISFTNYTEKNGLCNNVVRDIIEDKDGNLWFATSMGASKFDGDYFFNYTENEGLSGNLIWSVFEDNEGIIWFATYGGGVCNFDGNNFRHFTESEGLSDNIISTIIEDKTGIIWIGTNSGVNKYNGELFTHLTQNEGLISDNIYNIIEDKKGNLWFGSANGVCNYNHSSFTYFSKKNGLSGNVILSIFEDKTGNIWFGTYNQGITMFDGKTFVHFTENDGLTDNTIRCILEDKNGNIWFGTDDGACFYDGKSFTQITTNEGLSSNFIMSILEDKNGNIWFGTFKGGVTKYDGETFTHFTVKDGLSQNNVWSIYEDSDGYLWFGTDGGGVNMYDGETFTHFTQKEGLSNNSVLSIIEDYNENLWFGTRSGLCKLSNKRKLQFLKDSESPFDQNVFFENYSYEDGFVGIGLNEGKSLCEDQDGTIWAAANGRVTAYHPQESIEDTSHLVTEITSLDLYNEKIEWQNIALSGTKTKLLGNGVALADYEFSGVTKWYGLPENLSLAYNNNYITFNFIGINTNQPKRVRYQYKLEGIEQNWSALSSENYATYGNLPHGKYIFKVKSKNGQGYWSEPIEYAFEIRPPWWKTWWFRITLSILILTLLFGIYRWRTASLRTRQKQLEKTVEDRTVELVQKNIIVEEQKQIAEKQRELVEEKHKEITDSINYAERIQRSFLATKDLLDENLKEYFVFFQPKDVVSGDFYWATKLSNGNFALVTADSTGHGVPGAIMSILNITCLEKAVQEEKLVEPGEILNHARLNIIDRLKKDGSAEGGKDGMDASLVCFDLQNKKLKYAAANNPVWIVRQNEILEFAPDKMPVGKHDKQHIPFASNQVELKTGDVVYTLTDGMPDQFGGEKGKKFMYKKLKELLISIANNPMEMQREKLSKAFFDWKGDLEQVDDVCVIGVRV